MREKKKCSVDGCEEWSRRWGYCSKHSQRYQKYGDPLFTKYRTGPLADRLKGSTDASAGEDGCHPWTGDCNENGYGVIKFEGKTYIVTRAVMKEHLGRDLKSEEHVLHTCDNPPCSNRKHLYIGDPARNAKDRSDRGRHWRDRTESKTRCKNGHEYTPENTYMTKTGRSCVTCRKDANERYYNRKKGGGSKSLTSA